MAIRRYRVAQWGTGNIGLRALREVIRHPDLDLVGVRVYDQEKAGVDAGTLCGEPVVGIAATSDPAEIRALNADCVLHMSRAFETDEIVALLEAGTNVVTTRGEASAGGHQLPSDVRQRLTSACERGRSSLFATGSSPGFITDALPMTLLSLQRRVECVQIEEFANLSRRDSPHLLFELMGYGRPLETYDSRRSAYLLGEFGPALGALAVAAGTPVDRWEHAGEVAAARRTVQLAAGELPGGTIAAQRTTLIGYAADTERVRFTANWYCTADLDPQWDLLATGWRVRVRGDAPMDVEIAFPVPLEELGGMTPALTANRPVNAIPYVCQAPPGILTAAELPLITPAGPIPF